MTQEVEADLVTSVLVTSRGYRVLSVADLCQGTDPRLHPPHILDSSTVGIDRLVIEIYVAHGRTAESWRKERGGERERGGGGEGGRNSDRWKLNLKTVKLFNGNTFLAL